MNELKPKFTPFSHKIWLATPTMHGKEFEYMKEAYDTNWMSTVGENIDQIEEDIEKLLDIRHAVALSSGTAALHLAMKVAGIKPGDQVFCSDVTFSATINPLLYEKAEPIFIDAEYGTWNLCPEALEKAFELYPDVKFVVMASLYGTPGRMDEIQEICKRHHACLIEDAAESLGATYKGQNLGSFGDIGIISFNGNKIITGSSGGMLLTNDKEQSNKVRKWSTQSRENAPWYQHEEVGYNYRMSNIIAGVVRGQIPYLQEHIRQKREIYERYKEGLKDLPVQMNPFDEWNTDPNYWISCMLIDEEAMCKQVRDDSNSCYRSEPHKSCPDEILETLASYNIEGRPIWKPMHMQPVFRNNGFVTKEGNGRGCTNAYIAGNCVQVGTDLFNRGLCLPSDNKMTKEEQETVIAIIRSCFDA